VIEGSYTLYEPTLYLIADGEEEEVEAVLDGTTVTFEDGETTMVFEMIVEM